MKNNNTKWIMGGVLTLGAIATVIGMAIRSAYQANTEPTAVCDKECKCKTAMTNKCKYCGGEIYD